MAVNLNPNKGEEECIKCNEKIIFAMFPFDGSCVAYGSILEEDNKQFKVKGWICWNCAYEKEWTNETSLEGATTWCICCKKSLCFDDGNACMWCEDPSDIDTVYCTECWNNENIKHPWRECKNGSLASHHNECDAKYA